jgi:hypothetical protein
MTKVLILDGNELLDSLWTWHVVSTPYTLGRLPLFIEISRASIFSYVFPDPLQLARWSFAIYIAYANFIYI